MNKVKQERRSFLKQTLAGTAAAATMVAAGKKADAKRLVRQEGRKTAGNHPEILYKETEAFRKHYKNLYS